MTFPAAELEVGGGVISLSPLPARAADLASLKAWGAALLVSLTERHEVPEGFAETVVEAGLDWMILPIPDFGLPEGPRVAQALPELLARLGAGQRLAIHCKGGCGRSGMLVLRLMVEAGEAPDAALARLRAVRPCAIETEAQMAWARGDYSSLADPSRLD